MSPAKGRKRRSPSSNSSSDSDTSVKKSKKKRSGAESDSSENAPKQRSSDEKFSKKRRSRSPEHSRSHRNEDDHDNRRKFDEKRRNFRDDNRRNDNRFNRNHDRRFDRNRRDDDEKYSERRRSQDRNRRSPNRNRRDNRRRSPSFDHANAKWGKSDGSNKSRNTDKLSGDKQKPNFGLSGKLTEETNTYKGVVIKYSEPPEARKPKRRWRLYPFKGEKALQTLYIHRESAYLIGRDRNVVDLPVDHPSCSKQHAALQYRLVPFTRDDGSVGKRVRPYIIDLESANGTFINNKKIESKKYVELLERDVIKFGFSSREYVLLHENSKDEALDDDVKLEDEEVVVKKEET